MADAAVPADAQPRKSFVTAAGRCGECHDKMFDEWGTSAHARAGNSPLFVAARTAANQNAVCDRCHTPLAPFALREVASEGVSCDVCHTLRDAKPAATGAGFRLAVDDMVKYGPRCDLEDHYFHRMGCSPEHKESAVCGSCHWWEPAGLPVFTEFADWRAGPAAATPCQDCHMPKETAALAEGAPVRKGVPHHGLLGVTGDLRRRALGLEVAVRDAGGGIEVAVKLANTGGGHSIPSGLPERRVVVRLVLRDPSGTQVVAETRELGRVLVDAAGVEAPFWRATQVKTDARIAAGATATVAFGPFPAMTAGSAEIEVVHRANSDAVAKLLGVTTIDEYPMTAAKLAFVGGAKVPVTTVVKPAAAGKRKLEKPK